MNAGRLPSATHWSLLLQADTRGSAWEYFYDRYAPAVRALFRQRVRGQEVEDLVQAFFARALERDLLRRADPARGRFRAYLRTAAQRFLADHWRKAGSRKRRPPGGLQELDEGRAQPTAGGLSPAELFDLAWARSLLARATERAAAELGVKGKAPHAEAFRARRAGVGWDELAARHGTTRAAVRGWVRRTEELLARFVREEVAAGVSGPRDLEEELRELHAIVARGAGVEISDRDQA